MLLDCFKHFHLMERVTLSSSNSEIHLKRIFMPFHQWNSVFSREFGCWWLWFEWEWKAAFPHSFKHYRQEHISGLHYLIYVFVAKTQQGNNWGKTRLRLKLFWNNANTGFEEYQSRMIQSCQMWFFFPPSSVKWNFCRKKTWLRKVLLFQQISFLWWKVVPSQLFPVKLATYPFLGQIYSFAQRVSL